MYEQKAYKKRTRRQRRERHGSRVFRKVHGDCYSVLYLRHAAQNSSDVSRFYPSAADYYRERDWDRGHFLSYPQMEEPR